MTRDWTTSDGPGPGNYQMDLVQRAKGFAREMNSGSIA